MMAAQGGGMTVQGHARVAASAGSDPAAVVAHQHRRVAPAVEEHQALLAACQGLLQGFHERPGEAVVRVVAAHVDDPVAGRAGAAGAFGEPQMAVASAEGVAEPSTIGQPRSKARFTARSRAEYRNPSCCLNDSSCSSSTITRPRSGSGVNTPERVAMTIRAAPLAAARQASRRWVSESPE